MGRTPLIGVTSSVTFGRYPERAYVNAAYLLSVQQAGGAPVILTPHLDSSSLNALWTRLGGVLLTGGGDIDPARYGESPHRTVSEVSEERDALEIELVERALGEGVPLLAICRGIQVLNIALGGSLYQDIPTDPGSSIVHSQKERRHQPTHRVKIEDGSRLAATLGMVELDVNSFHHQAIKTPGRGIRPVAWSPDGIVEGVDVPDARSFALGVQWHPEDLVRHDPAARNLFAAFVEAAAQHSHPHG